MELLLGAYERLVSELVTDLHATCAVMETFSASDPTPYPVLTIGPYLPPEKVTWLEIPVYQENVLVVCLKLGFKQGVELPTPEERRMAQALLELVVLLGVSGWRQASLLAVQASQRILAVTEEELQHIILDIHDGPVQKLFAASSQVESLSRRLPQIIGDESAQEVTPELDRVANLLQASLTEIRNSLGTLRPPEFRRRPLVTVLKGLILQHETLTGMHVNMVVEGELPPVSLPVKIALYRIMQEALSNAYHHARVETLDVRVSADERWVTLEVVDKGPGFEPPTLEGPGATEREEHIGLRGMRDRAQLVGGQLRLTSRPGEGTRIQVKVPPDV